MRDLLIFLAFVAAVFFVVGETIGWQLGVAGQTPVFVYKQDGEARAERRTIQGDGIPVNVSGQVRDGAVTVRVIYEDRGSFQARREGRPPDTLYERTFTRGERIEIDDFVEEGSGEYAVELTFEGATGLFRVPMPNASEL